MHRIAAAVWMDLVPCLCTALGAGTVFLTGRRTAGPGRGAMGLSVGIMLGVGLSGLLLPAAEEGGWPAALAGFFAGAAGRDAAISFSFARISSVFASEGASLFSCGAAGAGAAARRAIASRIVCVSTAADAGALSFGNAGVRSTK